MLKSRMILLAVSSASVLVATAPQCGSSTPPNCTQTSTCPNEAGPDGPPALNCNLSVDPKDSLGCVDDRVGIFVSPTGSDTNPGTKEAPVQTITKGLAIVGTLTRVYICQGTYAEDVNIAPPADDGISIYGGFACADWSYNGMQPVVGNGTLALTISGTTKPLTVEDLSFQSSAGTTAAPSSIAALVTGATGTVTFTRVNLTAGAGANGPNGAAGSNYSASLLPSNPTIAGHNAMGASGGTLQMCSGLCTDMTASTGGTGGAGGAGPGDGSEGAPTSLGGGEPGNHTKTCGSGGSGSNGGNATVVGVNATSPTALGALSATGWASTGGGSGANGSVGQGGGGGAGQTGTGVGGGAGGGCGGCGGGGGSGGGGGGASVALAAFSSIVTVNASVLVVGDGGNGGNGSAGQVGQAGGYSGNQSNPGCLGGNGGTGSAGGTSAGGVGGISVGVLYKGNAPTLDSATMGATTLGTPGTKGTGGTPGTNDGIAGAALTVMQSP